MITSILLEKSTGAALLLTVAFTVAALAQDRPGGPPPGGAGRPGRSGGFGGSGGPGGRPPGGQSRDFKLSGVYTLNSGTAVTTNQTYSSAADDVSAILVSGGGDLTLFNPTVNTTGNSSSTENSSFYGLNAAVLATKSSKVTILGGSITTSGRGANGLFAFGAGAAVSMTSGTIMATGGGGHGVMASGGGWLALTNVNIETKSERAAPIATDRGSGTIIVSGGKMLSAGRGSPGIYSTGKITVYDAEFISTGAEAAVIEGRNSITLANCKLTGATRCGVMIYQSFSGDAEGREGVFTMTGGSLTATSGPLFFVTNTKGMITLKGVKASTASGILVRAGVDRWGRTGSNGGVVVFTADDETLVGDVIADAGCSASAALKNHTTLTGAIKEAALRLDATSKWNVTGDSTLTSLTNPDGVTGQSLTNIVGNGHTVRYDASLAANQWLGGKTIPLTKGGQLTPRSRTE